MKKILSITAMAVAAVAGLTLASCKKDDGMKHVEEQRTFSVENVMTPKKFVQSGSFKGEGSPPVVMPGQSVNFRFNAGKGQSVMFVTMYGKSKDWFFAPANPGIMLFDSKGKAMTGDVSSQIKLWDNGTKDNMTGEAESKPITEVSGVDAGMLLKVTLSYEETASEFTLTIMNASKGTEHETPFSPGVWAVSAFDGKSLVAPEPFFSAGVKSNPEISAIAQMGDITQLKTMLEANTGIMTGISPVMVVIYDKEMNPVFEPGKKDSGMGLKEIAQSGDIGKLKANLMKTKGVNGVYVAGDSPVGPGQKVSVRYKAAKGCKLAFITMYGFSNDWFYANEMTVPALDRGDITSKAALFDSGTGVSQYPGAGNMQALFGGIPKPESKPVAKVGNEFPVPSVGQVLKITIE